MRLTGAVPAALALVLIGCGDSPEKPKGLTLPAACTIAGDPMSGPEGLRLWEPRYEDSEHIVTPDEARPRMIKALDDAGWSLCGVAAGTSYYHKGERITTLAFGSDDRRDVTFGQVYLGQKPRAVECP